MIPQRILPNGWSKHEWSQSGMIHSPAPNASLGRVADLTTMLVLTYPSFATILYTDKKENQIFLMYEEIQRGAVAKSYMRKGFLIYEEMRKYFTIFKEAVGHIHMTLQLLHSEFPYIWGKFDFLFGQCSVQTAKRPTCCRRRQHAGGLDGVRHRQKAMFLASSDKRGMQLCRRLTVSVRRVAGGGDQAEGQRRRAGGQEGRRVGGQDGRTKQSEWVCRCAGEDDPIACWRWFSRRVALSGKNG